MRKLAYLSLPLLMIACGQEEKTETPVEEETSIEVEDTVVTTEPIAETTHGWYDYFKVSEFDFEVQADTLIVHQEPMGFVLPEEGLGMFANSMIYSPDSTHCIDLDSYGMVIDENENGEKEYMGTEVDSKVYLLDLQQDTINSLELMMCGTYCNPLDAEWKSNSIVNIMGLTYNEEQDQDFPAIWQYDISTGSFLMFVSSTPLQDGIGNYLEEVRLPLILNQ